VAPDGLIIAGGGPDTKLIALKDSGDRAEVVWRRDDIAPLTTSSQAGQVAYVVVADAGGQSLLVFDTTDGHTLNSYPIPDADGFPVGVSVAVDRRVVAATSAGQVYSFSPI
jgi:outer membrane protein assembly factor BamB